jgi:hypothetical protein
MVATQHPTMSSARSALLYRVLRVFRDDHRSANDLETCREALRLARTNQVDVLLYGVESNWARSRRPERRR